MRKDFSKQQSEQVSDPTTQNQADKAPVFFLLGTSTAGKTTILSQLQKNKWDVYGVDEDLTNDEPRCAQLLTRDPDSAAEFQKMKGFIQNGAFPKSAIHPFDQGTMGLLFALRDVDKFLQENKSLNEDVKETLKSLATKNPDFAEKSGFTGEAMRQRIFDHAIESSKRGTPIIIDGSDGMREQFEEYAKKQNYDCPTKVILVHVPFTELATRMEARNSQALAAGNLSNQRKDIRPFEQYSEFFGANADNTKLAGEKLFKADVIQAAEKFGSKEDVVKLCEKLGFQEGQDSIMIGVKIKTDAVFDHAKMSTAEVVKEISDLASQIKDEKTKGKKTDVDEESFVQKLGLKKPQEKKSFVQRAGEKDGKSDRTPD